MTPEARLRLRDKEMIPTILLRAMGTLVACALFITTYAVLTDRPLEAMPVMEGEAPILRERAIIIDADGATGAARVLDTNGTVIADLDPEQGGFIAGVQRALRFERNRMGVEEALPVRLVLFENGQLSLRDDATGWRAELIGFGAKNADSFAKLLN
ncbi:photosynthetic complex assembly protein PuhC [Jannaschia ovalis]|uniref:Photosynthetic complex assembly protein PuhC n=1 Tax=Jannaschia ovalis TaxID=3038773 RepID=A0ABY8LIL4_9RHOB|nr:photosynthetic complex assembly protein PuhC [Jannaschia sp. GRR-S6-38]WGH80250.1 photosynthetic complex assembly protein PuhC [Jannaschia sp. GRR-S6-38]